ncbi:uncharacterized protein KIAA1614 isoform X4 [Brienomyrus brachyistius]|uniref:uncharacterized protein KIAA1614 isoform X4 n=1 Tax=Brienomyrus brachyistius TaxID=42636 RepID=UPI0020B3D0C7|nr:uncharacterized protein KIAA1614 isoform X4 [Brienomyrus brachyistius]
MEGADIPVRPGGRRHPSPPPGGLRGVLPVDADQHPTASSPESGGPLPCLPPGSAVSALQSKVNALSKHRVVGKERDKRGQQARSSHTHGGRELSPVLPGPGSPPTCRSWHCSSDDEGESQRQDHTHPWDHLTSRDMEVQREVVGEDEGEGGATSSSSSLPWEASDEFSVEILQEGPSSKPRSPCKGFPRAGTPPMNGGAPLVEGSPHSEPAGSSSVWRELQRSDSLESHLRRYWEGEPDQAALLGGLWRADSWESICSGGGALSLAERVEMNRAILRQMLSKPRSKDTEGLEQRPKQNGNKATLNDSDWDSGISLQDGEHCTSRAFVLGDDLPLSPRQERAKRLLERARMKARSQPLKADHSILPVPRDSSPAVAPLLRSLPGKEGAASGNLSDSSSSDSACGPRRRYGQSPTRVRFEDESEKDAEVRYLERLRQRRRAGERAQGLLVSKPNLSAYVNGKKDGGDPGRAAHRGRAAQTAPECRAWGPQEDSLRNVRGRVMTVSKDPASRKCHSCGGLVDGSPGSHANAGLNPPSPQQPHGKGMPSQVPVNSVKRMVHTERIKETYIGEVAPTEDHGPDCLHSDGGNLNTRLWPPGEKWQVSGDVTVLPPNPYAVEQPEKPCHCSVSLDTQVRPLLDASGHSHQGTCPLPKKSALKLGPRNWPSGQRLVKLMPSPQGLPTHSDSPESLEPRLTQGAEQEPPATAASCPCQEQQCVGPGYRHESSSLPPPSWGPGPCIRPSVLKLPPSRTLPDHLALEPWDGASESAGHCQQWNGDQCQDPASASQAPHCRPDGRVRGPMRAEHLRANSPDMTVREEPYRRAPEYGSEQREGRSKLSLRKFFSAIGLNSVGKLVKARSSSMEHLSLPAKHSAAPHSPPHGQMKKAPSLQALNVESPLNQLRKASSVQSLQSPKRKTDRSGAYAPGQQPCSPVYRGLQRALSVEDVGCPSLVRSVGRVAQTFPDGTLLLELSRPSHGPFGFLISRGKGRQDSGVYVEEMGDSNTQKLYAGLLGIGDEILEVNGEKVAGLSLDQVTRLMAQEGTASVRVLRHRRFPR